MLGTCGAIINATERRTLLRTPARRWLLREKSTGATENDRTGEE